MTAGVLPDPATSFGKRVRRRLRDEQVIWFTAVASDGTPQPNPVWFVWDQDRILVYTRVDARRLVHISRNPQVTLHFDGDGRGRNIVVVNGRAQVLDGAPPPHEYPAYADKYRRGMLRVSGSLEAFGADYSVAIEVRITRVRGF